MFFSFHRPRIGMAMAGFGTALLGFAGSAAFGQVRYSVTVLQDPVDRCCAAGANANALNNHDEVVGWLWDGDYLPVRWSPEGQPALLVRGDKRLEMVPTATNDKGVSVGRVNNGGTERPPGRNTRAVLFTKDKRLLYLFPKEDDPGSMATAINEAGDVVGDATGVGENGPGFYWTKKRGTQLLAVDDPHVGIHPTAINNRRTVGGYTTRVHSGALLRHAFFWTPEAGWDWLDEGRIVAINDSDEAALVTADGPAVQQRGGPRVALPLADGARFCIPHAINANGDIAGGCDNDLLHCSGRPVVWLKGNAGYELVSLQDAIDPADLPETAVICSADDINDAGSVLVTGRIDDRTTEEPFAVVLKPLAPATRR